FGAGAQPFSLTHRYLDNPAGQANGSYAIGLSVTDPNSGAGTGSASVQVNNVAPSNVVLTLSSASINENGSVTLGGSFSDPGTLDTHAVVVNWGDGSATTTINLAASVVSFTNVGHQYRDNLAGLPNGSFPITVTVTEKDGG